MPRIGYRLVRLVAVLLTTALLAAATEPPAVLRRGINVTHWFRYPPSGDPAALRNYLDDATLRELKRTGFNFIRLPVQSDLLGAGDALVDAIRRIERHGLAVVVALFAVGWQPESDGARLLASWRSLAPMLRRLDPAMTFPEILNEPVFAGDPAGWAKLQHGTLEVIRAALPTNTVVLTGADWGSPKGLLDLVPEPDARVIYSFHLYAPAELTALGAYRPGLDTAAMSRLPFPVQVPAECLAAAATTRDAPTAALMRFYCTQGWDVAKLSGLVAAVGDWAKRNHVAVLAGEFGATQQLNKPARLAWLQTVRAACEQRSIGWALWGFDDVMGFGMRPRVDVRRSLDGEVLDALGLRK